MKAKSRQKTFSIDGHKIVTQSRTHFCNPNGFFVSIDGGPKTHVFTLYAEIAAKAALKRWNKIGSMG